MGSLIGISGNGDGVGKDSVATAIQGLTLGFNKEIIVEHIKSNKGFGRTSNIGYERKPFSEPIKQIICILTGCTMEQLEDRDFKESIMPREWWFSVHVTLRGERIIKSYNHLSFEELVNSGYISADPIRPTYRWAMRHIGSELFRDKFHPQTWINARFSTFSEDSHWVIPDVRFPNELITIRENDGIVLRVINSKKENTEAVHQSESSLDNDVKKWGYYAIIDNCGSIEDLVNIVEEVCKKLGIVKK